MFSMNQQLANDTFIIGEFELSTVTLMNNSLFPWVILIPKRADVKEIIDLSQEDRITLMDEIAAISKVIREIYWPDKINVASLGNVVSQLHVHVIARFKTDHVWPEPVWGKGAKPYTEEGMREAIEVLRRECGKQEGFSLV